MKNKKDFDFITVGIIALNEEKSITNTLSHLLDQSYPKDFFEIVMVIGKRSVDKTREKANDYLSGKGIAYKILNEGDFRNEDGGYDYGHSFARNVIIDNCSDDSKYVAWIDADCRAGKDWLLSLWKKIKDSAEDIAGAGGPRLVEREGEVSGKELMLNYYFTSCIMSLGNPAFCNREAEFIGSLAGYNSIYKKDILEKFRYCTRYPFNIDDIEINFRIRNSGYRFLYSREAQIYHRLDETIGGFLKHMITYGKGAANVAKIHKKSPRIYIPISLLYLVYIILLPLTSFISFNLTGDYLLPFYPFVLVLFLAFAVFLENIVKTRSFWSLNVLYIVPLHPLMYGVGVIKSFIDIGKK